MQPQQAPFHTLFIMTHVQTYINYISLESGFICRLQVNQFPTSAAQSAAAEDCDFGKYPLDEASFLI